MPIPFPSPKRFNPWPVGIIAFFVVFVACIIGFVIFSVVQRTDLVAADYYDQEVRFQEQIDRVHRTAAWKGEIAIEIDPLSQHLRVALPAAHAARRPTGTVAFYRPSEAGLDRRFPLLVDPVGQQVLDVGGFAAGLWRVRVTWTVGREEFYREADVVLGRRGGGGEA